MQNLRQHLRKYDPRPELTRILHPARRYFALRSLSRDGVSGPVLFVCFGNICRSPYAAAKFKSRVKEAADVIEIEVASAGFTAPGRPCPRGAISNARERGCELGKHVSRQIDRAAVMAAEWVFVMNTFQATEIRRRFGKPRARVVVLGDLDPISTGVREVEDPWNRGDDVFRRSYERIDRCLEAIVREVVGPLFKPALAPAGRVSSGGDAPAGEVGLEAAGAGSPS